MHACILYILMKVIAIIIIGLLLAHSEELCKQYICNSTIAKLDSTYLDSTPPLFMDLNAKKHRYAQFTLLSISELCASK